MNQKQLEGRIGEEVAASYLDKNGYIVICKNFRCMQGEIDIIAKDKEEIVFVEVKTRTSTDYGEAREAVGKEKQKHIYKAAEYYLYKYKIDESFTRIDVIEVYIFNRKDKSKSHKTSNLKFLIEIIREIWKIIQR